MTDPIPQSPPTNDDDPPADAEAAFVAMVEAHYARLGAFATRLVGSRAAAEDVVHEVLLRIWRRREVFSFQDPLGYLYQAVRHEADSWHRRHVRELRRTAGEETGAHRADPRADTSHDVEAEELAAMVERTVASLPPRRREIFRMQREQGLSYAEIASLLGISVKTVEVQIGYALRAIRQRLGPFLALAVTLLK
jgi:RNA polymerase sigma-70 factor (ECF subfamily)